jgi:hypothetical protein
MQDGVQQRTVDFDVSVIVDQAKLAELVHEVVDARSGGANHSAGVSWLIFGVIGRGVSRDNLDENAHCLARTAPES